MSHSKIGWADYSGGDLNVVIRGRNCPVSEGCAHCYVERWARQWGRELPETTTIYPGKLGSLWKTKWPANGHKRGPGSKPVLFPADFGDLFHPDIDEEFILAMFDMMHDREDADWVVLTKRAEQMHSIVTYWLDLMELARVPPHIWLMVTAENQRRLDERVPWLLKIPVSVYGVSLEPMLGPISVRDWLQLWNFAGLKNDPTPFVQVKGINWVIVGAESGPDRRPFKVEWAVDVYDQCRAAGVAFFGKQDSGLRPGVPLVLPGIGEVKQWPKP